MTFLDVKPRLRVGEPPFTPYPYGLASVARSVPDADDHWQIGVDWQSPHCGQLPAPTSDQCFGFDLSPPNTKVATDCQALQFADPFTVYAMLGQSPVGVNAEAWLRARLEGGEWAAVERYVESLLAATDVALSGSTLDSALALGALENAIANEYGGLGVIHVSRAGATVLASHNLLTVTGGRLTTILGTPVAAEAWTPSSPPPVPSSFTIYGTGATFYRRSDVLLIADAPSSLNRSTNTLAAVAERTWLVGWDCVNFSVTASVT